MLDLLDAHNVEYITEGNHHCTPGWIQLNCPHCDDHGYHLGYNLDKKYFNCYRCGWLQPVKLVSTLFGVSEREAISLLNGVSISRVHREKKVVTEGEWVTLPTGAASLTTQHRQYLLHRGYSDIRLERCYSLYSTGMTGSYKFRIIAPVFHLGRMVSYVGRDVTNKAKAKYKTCASTDETRSIKDCLYALDDVTGGSVVVTEGVSDVWRMGRGSVATFGVGCTGEQVKLLKRFDHVYIMYDNDPVGNAQGEKLAHTLSPFVTTVNIVQGYAADDPGGLSHGNARAIMRELLG